jgi:hypothetical protein
VKRLLPVLAVVLAAGAASAAAQAPPPTPPQPGGGSQGPPTRQMRVTAMLNRAIDRTYRARPACRPPNPLERRTTFTDDPPRQETLDAFAILRRPGTPAERAAAEKIRDLPAEGIYRNHVRFARSASGRRLTVVVARDTSFYEPRAPECVTELRTQARRVLRRAHEDAKTRRAFRRGLEQVIRDDWTAPAAPEEDGFFVLASGGGAGGSGLSDVKRRGVLLGMGGSARRAARFDLVVPDGVARVRLAFRGGPTRTAAVRENVVSVRVRTRDGFPLPVRMVWLAADGSRVRTVRFP